MEKVSSHKSCCYASVRRLLIKALLHPGWIFLLTLLIFSLQAPFLNAAPRNLKEVERIMNARNVNVLKYRKHLFVRSKTRNYLHSIEKEQTEVQKKSKAPLINGDGFRSICNHIYDEQSLNFAPQKVQLGEIVFVSNMFFDDFIENYHHLIDHPYILITHNGVFSMPGPYVHLLEDDKIIAWFSHNVEEYVHPKLYPLPVGIPNSWYIPVNLNTIKSSICRSTIEKKHLCYLNINPGTYRDERDDIISQFKGLDYVYHQNRKRYSRYIEDMICSKFVISPRGRGLDCFRHWECLYVDTIPIIKSSSLDPLFDDLPILLINDWKDVTKELLIEKYEEITKIDHSTEKLNLEYWLKKIFKVQREFLSDWNDMFSDL